ncbi:MAG: shikimate kinase [Desulfobaccales bacterium]
MTPASSSQVLRSLVLIGFRATGKTAVGRLLARALGWPLVDLDTELMHEAGKTIAEIVAAEGWEGFRRREKELVERYAGQRGMVLTPGGGVVLDPQNVARLKENGILIWLTAPAAVIRERLARDAGTAVSRPGLRGGDPLAEVEAILKEREPLYRAAADIIIDTTDLTPEQVAARILEELKSAQGA